MNRVDLHVHSCHSRHPSEWFLQRLGAQESYTDVETVYQRAKARGAAFVTLTDHNTIAGAQELIARHPDDCFVSTESTAYFPEDGCKVHVLCWGITPGQFAAIQKARTNIYNLRDNLRLERIACSVAHATFSVNGRLTVEHIEKLILLFDAFEGINGTRGRVGNVFWQTLLERLTPQHIDRLVAKHGIEPWGPESWVKGLTGGSDDHAGLFIGDTYTLTQAATIPAFLEALRTKRMQPGGRHGDHKSFAYAIYKIASEYARQKGGAKGLPGLLASILFDENGPALRDRFAIKRLGWRRSTRDRMLSRFLERLLEITRTGEQHGPEWQVEQAHAALSRLLDDCLAEMARALERGVQGAESSDLFQYLGVALPAGFFAAPFFTTLRMQHRGRELHAAMEEAFGLCDPHRDTRTLWFSDTVTDLNGVAVTLQETAACARQLDRPLRAVGCLAPDESRASAPPGLINLPCIYAVTPAFYDAHTLRVPSLLRSIDLIAAAMPDRIVISTPGPVGLVGLAAARLLGVTCIGIYHTDFARQTECITGDADMVALVEGYTRWFFGRMDELRVPSTAYMNQLADRGLDRHRMRLFPRGLAGGSIALDPATLDFARGQWFTDERPTLLYAGRLGQEKNLFFLLDVFRALRAHILDAHLVVAGDGPSRAALEAAAHDLPGVIFAGRLERAALRACYALADVFVFPSQTDTFGMAVLEAQAFGLPSVVADVGGPPEIVQHGRTGYALPADDPDLWVQTLARLCENRRANPVDYARWREEIRDASRSAHNWETVLDDIMGPQPAAHAAAAPAVIVSANRPDALVAADACL